MRHVGQASPSTPFARHGTLDNMTDLANKHDLLQVELDKWDRDFRFLLECFRDVLASIHEPELAGLVEEAFSTPPSADQRMPARGAQALSVVFQLLNMAVETPANQIRRVRETVQATALYDGT